MDLSCMEPRGTYMFSVFGQSRRFGLIKEKRTKVCSMQTVLSKSSFKGQDIIFIPLGPDFCRQFGIKVKKKMPGQSMNQVLITTDFNGG